MNTKQEIEALLFNDSENVLRSQNDTLKSIKAAIERSENIDMKLQQSIKKTWECSRQELSKKMADTYGEPSDRDIFIARKIMEDKLKVMEPESKKPQKKAFFVNNPI